MRVPSNQQTAVITGTLVFALFGAGILKFYFWFVSCQENNFQFIFHLENGKQYQF